ncbi:MAG TPA: hypothetical protein PLC10_14520 [Flavobacteriales bacterium]|nr:hypothetical protein [Flavobacteriales bacterium]
MKDEDLFEVISDIGRIVLLIMAGMALFAAVAQCITIAAHQLLVP